MDFNKIDFNKFFRSKSFKIITLIIIGVIVFLLIFNLGMIIGFRKANFSYKWGENYHQNFAGPRGGFFRDFGGRDFIEPHGVFGQIIKIEDSTLIIKSPDNVEKTVIAKDDTVIERFRETIKLTDLKIDDQIVVIGEPNTSGQIEAKFIRIMPQPKKEMPMGKLPDFQMPGRQR
ncbi:MAG: hypothetical protein PHE59_02290 [Patescibacteria group bacterium]|nr:hypothetical protein [Patescibacteria group bacterium]MDD5164399.1 hypothetical protein [Patescibacteria group bacterium]MDD5534949.1 hypothetical protein [Patescibacteria group bacterium]